MDKKELNLEELEKVSGGRARGNSLPENHGDYVFSAAAQYLCGQKIYIVNDENENEWVLAKLISSKMEFHFNSGGYLGEIYHHFEIINTAPAGFNVGFKSDECPGETIACASNVTVFKEN